MKKKRNLTLLVVLFAMVALGIGYAAATQDLTINGKAAGEAKDFVVKFSKKTLVKDATDVIPGTITDYTAAFTADLKQDNSKVIYFEIVNESSELDAVIDLKSANASNHFNIEIDYWKGDSTITDPTALTGNHEDVIVIPKGGNIWACVTVKRSETNPIVDTIEIANGEDVALTLTATAQAPSVN